MSRLANPHRRRRRQTSGPFTNEAGQVPFSIESKDYVVSYDGPNITISESKVGKTRILSVSKTLATQCIEILSRPDYSKESWEITCYDGDSSLKVFWDSNRFGRFVRLHSYKASRHIFIPASYNFTGLNIFCKGLSQLLRTLEDRNLMSNQQPLLIGTTEIVGNAKIVSDEGWRCAPSERDCGREEEEQEESVNRISTDSALKLEWESTSRQSTDAVLD
ncbi:hypothetical protein DM860_017387 [Cuscuta australis]|uniref:Uncharacterized protein n=1 Tax=Cuscuta australis TaxID=267555 RepID=A0A328DU52_9ASTE|nr:hypothetical protein DM860_017387 [Cuscuta australis]